MKRGPILITIILMLLLTRMGIGQDIPADELMDHCTSVMVTKGASIDGSVMTSHSVDGSYEFRIHIVPGKKHEPGTMRPVYKGGGFGRENDQAVVVGEIPEVAETFSRYDAAYSFMNEKQLGIGETTIGGKRELYNDEGWFDIMELQRIALERCTTARDAIQVMGDLATEYGYGDFGECLTIIDPKEVWMFEIYGAGPIDIGAVWAAQRIPDGHIGVSANRGRITTINLKDKKNFMASDNVHSLAEEMGYWDPNSGEAFRYDKAYGRTPTFNNLRREWRVIDILAPSTNRDPWDREIPFSVKPDKKVSPRDLMKIHRDYYEGTEFDMTKGLAAGPHHTPTRYSTPQRAPKGTIGWERSISIFRCAYCVVLQCRDWLPDLIGGLTWFGQDDPKATCFVPFYGGVTRVPECYKVGGRDKFERTSAWWAFNFLANWAELKFSYMIEDIKAKYTEFEDSFFELQPIIEKTAVELYKKDPELAREYITDYTCTKAQATVDAWWDFSDYMVAKYSDGYIKFPKRKSIGYPEQWLKKVGYGETIIQDKK